MTNFFQNEHGQGMVEYGLLIGFIALAVLAALFALGPKIRDLFNNLSDESDSFVGNESA